MVLNACTLVALFFAAVPPLPGATSERPRAQFSAEELRMRIGVAQSRIESFLITSRSFYNDPEMQDAGAYVQRIMAAKAPGFLMSLAAHGTHELGWELDPTIQRVIITADHSVNVNDVNRTYLQEELPPGQALPGTLPLEMFFHATGLYPLTERPTPKRVDNQDFPSVLVDIASSDAFTFVRPLLEQVDGQWCHVLERPGHDVLWVDVARGCILLARESYHPKTGARMWRYECSGHSEAAPGIWMPKWIRNIQFDYLARTDELRSKRVIDSRTDLLSIEVNCVDEARFTFEPPAGALRIDSEGRTRQAGPGGIEHLDYLVAWSKQALKPRWQNATPSSPTWMLTAERLRWGGIGLVSGLLVALTLGAGEKREPLAGAAPVQWGVAD